MVPNLLAGPDDPPERHRWTSVLDVYVNGGILVLDEFDALMSGALLAMNAMLANRRVLLQNQEYANRHPDFVCIAIGNTFGTGADDVYSGRNTLDGASLNRFAGRVFVVNYDPNVERGLMSGVLGADGVSAVFDRVNSLRERMVANKVRQIISTRHMQQASIDFANGDSLDLIEAVILSSWSPDERRSVGYTNDPSEVIANAVRSEADNRSPVGSPTGAV
jgi:cobaltochelatase CobS